MFLRFLLACTAALLIACGGSSKEDTLSVKGSDTMVHLVTAWAEAFPGKVAVTGGG